MTVGNDWQLFIDDDRVPGQVYDSNDGWTICRTLDEVQKTCERRGPPSAVSFDHDMGTDQPSGYEIAEWMIDNGILPDDWRVHSANPVGAQRIRKLCEDGMTRQMMRESFEAGLEQPIDAGQDALDRADELIAKYEDTDV